MELSTFSENIVIVPYERGGETVDLSVNIDAFTPEFFRSVGERFKGKVAGWKIEDKKTKARKRKPAADKVEFFESEARELEIKREVYAELLSSGVLTGWTLTENEIPIAPSLGVLLKLPPRLVEELWLLCLDAAKTVKKRVDGEIEETSESTPSGSRAPLALAPTG